MSRALCWSNHGASDLARSGKRVISLSCLQLFDFDDQGNHETYVSCGSYTKMRMSKAEKP
jgi:hypothetical protein